MYTFKSPGTGSPGLKGAKTIALFSNAHCKAVDLLVLIDKGFVDMNSVLQ